VISGCSQPDLNSQRSFPSGPVRSGGDLCAFYRFQEHSFHRAFALVEDQTVEVVGEIGQDQFGLGTRQSDGADKQSKVVLLMPKNMFDLGAHRGFAGIGPGHRLRHGFAPGLRAVNAAGQHVFSQPFLIALGAIGAVGPHIRGRVILAHHMAQLASICS